jgi:hypothetical protein
MTPTGISLFLHSSFGMSKRKLFAFWWEEDLRLRPSSVLVVFFLFLPTGCALFSSAEIEKCLPGGITLDTRFSLADYPREPITVKRKLIQLGAYCHNGKIFDRWGREIYFYQVPEDGGPWRVEPLAAPTTAHEEDNRLKSLEKRYRVIKMYLPDLPCRPADVL